MHVNLAVPTHCSPGYRVSPGTIERWITRAEAADLNGLWVLDHLTETPLHKTNFLDPLMTLAHTSAISSDLDLGTSILILPLRRAPIVASQVATLQHLTGGSVRLGVGAGYVEKEFEAVGVPLSERGPRLSEGIAVVQGLLEGEFSFSGRFHDFENVRIDPLPETPPELYAAGNSVTDDDAPERHIPEPVLDRILQVNGWISAPSGPKWAESELEIVTDAARSAGGSPSDVGRVMLQYAHLSDATDRDEALAAQREAFGKFFSEERGFESAERHCLVGTIDDVVERLASYRRMGFDEVIFAPITSDPDELDRQMDLLEDHVFPEFD